MAELKGAAIDRYWAKPDPAKPIVLLHGPDRGRVFSRLKDLVGVVLEDTPDPMARVDLSATTLDENPGVLAEEADSISMFGGKKAVVARIDDPKKLTGTVAALLEKPPQDAIVIIAAGELRKGHSLRTRIERSDTGVAVACYADGARDLAQLIDNIVGEHNLGITREARTSLLALMGADHGLSTSELEKLCLFAQSDGEIRVDHVEAVLADTAAVHVGDIADLAYAGDAVGAAHALTSSLNEGADAGVIAQSLLRQGQALESMSLAMAAGSSLDRVIASVRPPVFFKRRPLVERALQRWRSAQLRKVLVHTAVEASAIRLEPNIASTRLERLVLQIARTGRGAA